MRIKARITAGATALGLLLSLPVTQTTLASGGDPSDPAPASEPAAIAQQLDWTEARYRTVAREYRLDGIIEAIHRTTVSAQTQGQVEEIFYDVDDFVNKGEVLVRLRDTEHRTRVAQAAAELKAAAAQLQQAEDEFARVEGLFKNKNVSESAMDQAEADLQSAQARLEAAQAGLAQANEQLEYTRIRAPYSGIVTHRHVEVGEIASPGQQVMSGISLEQLRVVVDVPQSVIPAVREFGKIKVYLPDGEVVEAGRITVFPFADMGSNTFTVRVDLNERTQGLFPGMFVKTGIVTGKKRELTVPRSAVVYRSEVTGVYVLADSGRISLRQVRVGRALGDDLVLLSGLTEGERVALDPIAAGVVLKAQVKAALAAGGQPHD
ncbi:efflux RND transporter periplasmic adaptor subunit [Thiohalocapsa marina]|uniref:Efflux RND transporter periplasmic adaptor subunit n=1 Tax=Thiohalocapsa marina TaxID=424902 RepID=A0A5M8FUD9_9GAMM|nr:efflux RND transporter periplasmic adaptor subunit [Thiohalocapsa marina]KAA6187417.1 efflux RND transporter periplasmic adaptor subunit [Thiohalocapsa marina]